MIAAATPKNDEPIPPGEHVPTADQRIVMYGVPWSHFEAQLALRGDCAGPRMTYLDGALELMSPTRYHEGLKSVIGRLIEVYATEHGIDFGAYGGWTLKHAPKEAGVEPDECYIFGSDQRKETPDLAIEVVWTSGGIEKLEVYRRLGVGEVWYWKEGQLTVYLLEGDRYAPGMKSRCLPELDVELLASFLDRPTAGQAVRAFRDALRDGGARS